MGKTYAGTPPLSVRMPEDVREQLGQLLLSTRVNRRASYKTQSDFVISAVREKIAKRERSRRRSAARSCLPVADEGYFDMTVDLTQEADKQALEIDDCASTG